MTQFPPGAKRLRWVAGALAGAWLVVVARAFDLAILRGDDLGARAERQQRRTLRLAGYRGRILDRTGQPLAVTVDLQSVFASPAEVADPVGTARRLAPLLGVSASDLRERLDSDRSFVWLARGISPRRAARLQALGLQGIGLVPEPHRFYPGRELAAHVIGFAGEDGHGLEGVELLEDRLLAAPERTLMVECDARGVPLTSEVSGNIPARGRDLVLTLDHRIQLAAERALERGVQTTRARGGMAVVLDPTTGEILALAVAPPYNPNRFSEVEPARWRDRVVTDTFEPGSTLKVFVVAAALDEGKVRPGEAFDCEHGVMAMGDEPIHDWKPFGRLTLAEVLKYSSNIGAVKIGSRLGRAGLEGALRSFGFGAETGVDLPGEVAGLLPPSRLWSARTARTIAFGQGIGVTAIQLAAAFAAVANGGTLLRPRLLLQVRDAQGRVLEETSPQPVRRVLSAATARRMAGLLEGVISAGGTGERAAIPGYLVAGKTGTAQKALPNGGGYSRDRQVASFLGFAPADHPRLSIVVVIDEPQKDQGGGAAAAPIFRELAGDALVALGVPPAPGSNPQVSAAPAPTAPSNGAPAPILGPLAAGQIPDFRGLTLREALRSAVLAHVTLRVAGLDPVREDGPLGRIAFQLPPPGSAEPEGGTVTVRFHPEDSAP